MTESASDEPAGAATATAGDGPTQAERREPGSEVLDPAFLAAVRRCEEAPHNRQGSDKTWVERLLRDVREHLRKARREPR